MCSAGSVVLRPGDVTMISRVRSAYAGESWRCMAVAGLACRLPQSLRSRPAPRCAECISLVYSRPRLHLPGVERRPGIPPAHHDCGDHPGAFSLQIYPGELLYPDADANSDRLPQYSLTGSGPGMDVKCFPLIQSDDVVQRQTMSAGQWALTEWSAYFGEKPGSQFGAFTSCSCF